MEKLAAFIHAAGELLPAFGFIVLAVLFIAAMERFFRDRPSASRRLAFFRGVTYLLVAGAGVVGSLLALPVDERIQTNLVTLFGIVVSAIFTLSSTTFVGNSLAGLLLRTISHFKPGDFIRVGDHFGRVSEMGVFHTEIQTADAELVSLSNLYLVTEPVTVVRASGAIISAEVSLGYDVPHTLAERALAQAVDVTGLKDPFVQIISLGDYSVVYRCAGLLENVTSYFSTLALLRANMIDLLHEHGIEIVSPAYLTRRALTTDMAVIPDPPSYRHTLDSVVATGPRASVVFDKAERAAAREKLKKRIDDLTKESAEMEKKLAEAEEGYPKRKLERDIERNQAYQQYLTKRLAEADKEQGKDD